MKHWFVKFSVAVTHFWEVHGIICLFTYCSFVPLKVLNICKKAKQDAIVKHEKVIKLPLCYNTNNIFYLFNILQRPSTSKSFKLSINSQRKKYEKGSPLKPVEDNCPDTSRQKHLVLDSNTNPNDKATLKGGLVSENIQHATGLSSDEDDGEEPDGQENLTPNLLFTPNDLTKLLKQTDIGKRILQNSNPALSIDSKKELATIIAGHHLTCSWSHAESAKRKLSQFMLENYVSCIKLRFPQETSDAVRSMLIYSETT